MLFHYYRGLNNHTLSRYFMVIITPQNIYFPQSLAPPLARLPAGGWGCQISDSMQTLTTTLWRI